MQTATAVQHVYDFIFQGLRYQVKGSRPTGKKGSTVTWVPKPSNYELDRLIWGLYSRLYEVQKAWLWKVQDYRQRFEAIQRLGPAHMRLGLPVADLISSSNRSSSWSGR